MMFKQDHSGSKLKGFTLQSGNSVCNSWDKKGSSSSGNGEGSSFVENAPGEMLVGTSCI